MPSNKNEKEMNCFGCHEFIIQKKIESLLEPWKQFKSTGGKEK